jgi:membrane protease YdiL (CAAX protease family)
MSTETADAPARNPTPLLLEAVFPVAASQAYIWLAPYERPRWWDVAFGVVVGALIVAYVLRRGIVGWRTFGLARGRNHLAAAAPVGLFTGVVVVGLLGWGSWTGGLRRDWDIAAAIALYPIWGIVQQGVMFGIAYPRFATVLGQAWAIAATATLFALAHSPNPLLMIGGGLMVAFYGLVWRRWPSLPVIAVSHGVIGAVCDKALHVSMRVGAHYLAS